MGQRLEARIAIAQQEARHLSRNGIERRTVRAVLEGAAAATDREFRGYAAVFNDLSVDLGLGESWFERVEPGAFASVLRKGPDVRALFNHDPNLPLARSTVKSGPGSLLVVQDQVGLRYEFDPTLTSYAADLRANVKAGVVDQSSFAFRVARHGDSWEEDEDGRLVRTILQFSELFDVSPVTYPAYPTTHVGTSSAPSKSSPASRARRRAPSVLAARRREHLQEMQMKL